MRAVVVSGYGEPDVLTEVDQPEPVPGDGEVSIEVDFAAVNFADTKLRRGTHPRAPTPPFVLGREVSGRIREVGADVEGFRVGDLVAGRTPAGGYAEVVVADANVVVRLGDEVEDSLLPHFAASPTVVGTSILVLEHVARMQPGECVLVHGAAGGLGMILGQLSRSLGAVSVLGTVGRSDKVDAAREAGYSEVFTRETHYEELESSGWVGKIDVIVDPIGGEVRRSAFDMLGRLGRLVAIGETSSEADVCMTGGDLRKRGVGFLGISFDGFLRADPQMGRQILVRALDLVVRREVVFPRVTVLPLGKASEAHARLESGEATGKFVLDAGAGS